jgi:TetR/AcrR family transcriptional regulator, repressor of fatR-cypB operon
MARLIDETKIGRIKEATIELVVNNGYGGASISSIARKAGVAEGYLYRFYSSKQELVSSLLYTKVEQIISKLELLLESCTGVKEVIDLLISEFFCMARKSPVEVKFIHVLMHDYNFQVSDEQREQIKRLCNSVIGIGKRSGELNPETTAEEVFGMAIIYPIEFINLRMKVFFGKSDWTVDDKKRVSEFCNKALK